LRIDRSGALIIEDDTGKEQRIISGEVSVTLGEKG
jgi:biotin-(acetyl-CoA carboxylase) ligase